MLQRGNRMNPTARLFVTVLWTAVLVGIAGCQPRNKAAALLRHDTPSPDEPAVQWDSATATSTISLNTSSTRYRHSLQVNAHVAGPAASNIFASKFLIDQAVDSQGQSHVSERDIWNSDRYGPRLVTYPPRSLSGSSGTWIGNVTLNVYELARAGRDVRRICGVLHLLQATAVEQIDLPIDSDEWQTVIGDIQIRLQVHQRSERKTLTYALRSASGQTFQPLGKSPYLLSTAWVQNDGQVSPIRVYSSSSQGIKPLSKIGTVGPIDQTRSAESQPKAVRLIVATQVKPHALPFQFDDVIVPETESPQVAGKTEDAISSFTESAKGTQDITAAYQPRTIQMTARRERENNSTSYHLQMGGELSVTTSGLMAYRLPVVQWLEDGQNQRIQVEEYQNNPNLLSVGKTRTKEPGYRNSVNLNLAMDRLPETVRRLGGYVDIFMPGKRQTVTVPSLARGTEQAIDGDERKLIRVESVNAGSRSLRGTVVVSATGQRPPNAPPPIKIASVTFIDEENQELAASSINPYSRSTTTKERWSMQYTIYASPTKPFKPVKMRLEIEQDPVAKRLPFEADVMSDPPTSKDF